MPTAGARAVSGGPVQAVMVATGPLVIVLSVLALGSYWLTLVATIIAAVALNDGFFVYTLDDPYIHLAMARNLAWFGSYGIEPGQFSSASSSPAWTLMLALLFRLVPATLVEVAPLLLNLLSGSAVLMLWLRLVARHWPMATTRWQAAWCCIGAVLLPLVLYLPGLALIGLEHSLHLLLTLLFIAGLVDRYAPVSSASPPDQAPSRPTGPPWWRRRHWLAGREWLMVIAALLPLVRLEGLLLVGLAALWQLWERRRGAALQLLLAGGLPLVVMAAINSRQGELWLPNSVLAKTGVMPEQGESTLRFLARAVRVYLERWSQNLGYDGGLLVVAGLVLALLAWRYGQGRLTRPTALTAGLFLATLMSHMAVAAVGWFERYQAYLIMFGLLALGRLAGRELVQPRPLTGRLAIGGLLLLLGLGPLFHRQLYDQALAWQGSNNIYQQQIQMARFVGSAYAELPVAANDIGALSYYRPGRLLDLYGLGSIEVLRLRRAGRYDAAALDRLVNERGIRLAIIYDSFFPVGTPGSVGSRPGHWRRVATWELGGFKVTPANRTISFYAIGGEAEVQSLAAALRAFEARLPRGVRVRYDG